MSDCVKAVPIARYIIIAHAVFEARRRGIDLSVVRAVLSRPEQRLTMRPGRVVLQSRLLLGVPKRSYLVRVVVDVDRFPAEVVTVYRTTKFAKYWKDEP